LGYLVTTISFPPGRTRANNSLTGLSDGVLSVTGRQESGSVHVIADVSGAFR